ncbi:MAG: amidohydrolase family protein [Anaerolineae bacterium]|nr:amidohydrolase family protein [Anaerolineae bacterium]MDQ7035548.1 amidohydrolase family protein [Anaerolineae bacterium]
MSIHIKGAQVWDASRTSERDLYVKNGRIISEKPNHAVEVDLEGYTIFPGLINAHDHLELNHFPRTKFRDVYDNAHQWGEDVNARLNDEPFKTLRSYPLWDKVFIGGLKNLLCGATTVVHHGAPHKPMYRKDLPVRVLKNYGWAHSLHFNTEEEIIRSYQNTPKNYPWFIHLAEGTDDIAAGEYQRLKKLGCVGENTVIVHGVGMTEDDIVDASKIIQGFVICPTTNMYLLSCLANLQKWYHDASNKVFLGSDSRLTADSDFLDEIRFTALHTCLDDDKLIRLLQNRFYDVFMADFICFKSIGWSNDCYRRELDLVIKEGIPQIGDPDIMAKFSSVQTVACTLNGVEKRMNVELARQVHRCKLKEQGLEVDELPKGKRFIFF